MDMNYGVRFFQPTSSRVVNDLPDLVPAMFALLQVALIKGGAV